MGFITPIGNDVETVWSNMVEGVSGVGRITHFDTTNFDTKIAGEVKGFNAEEYMDRKTARHIGRYCQFALAASKQALAQSGLEPGEMDPDDVGVIVSSGIGGMEEIEKSHTALMERGPKRISPFTVPMMIADMAAGIVAIHTHAGGPNYAIVSACASGSHGIGEGSVMLVLEDLEHAKARGARVLAEISGYGASADMYHFTAPQPEGKGAIRAMRKAIEKSGVDLADIGYVNAHGTSTKLGDVAETRAIKAVFGDHAYKLAVSSTKSVHGHLLGAAGAIEAAACVLALDRGQLPPTINLDDPDPDCDLDYVPNKARKADVNVAISNSFGFGGHNASLVIKAPEAKGSSRSQGAASEC